MDLKSLGTKLVLISRIMIIIATAILFTAASGLIAFGWATICVSEAVLLFVDYKKGKYNV